MTETHAAAPPAGPRASREQVVQEKKALGHCPLGATPASPTPQAALLDPSFMVGLIDLINWQKPFIPSLMNNP